MPLHPDAERIPQSYDRLAEHWAGENGPHVDNGIAAHRRAIQFVRERGRALDVGCGSSGRLIKLLLAEGFTPDGIDISKEMIRLAKAKHPGVRFHCADVLEWEPDRQFDLISAWDSIWHVALSHQPAVLKRLCGWLAPQGVLIFTTGGTDHPGEVSNPCQSQPLYHAALGLNQTLRVLDDAGCACRHLEFDQGVEAGHVFIIAQRIDEASP